MQESELPGLIQQVLWASFALAVAFGAVAQRTHFCTMGAVADIVNIGDWSRMRMWALAAGVAMIGFNTMVGLGWVEARNTVYGAPRLIWLSYAVGGLLFGLQQSACQQRQSFTHKGSPPVNASVAWPPVAGIAGLHRSE